MKGPPCKLVVDTNYKPHIHAYSPNSTRRGTVLYKWDRLDPSVHSSYFGEGGRVHDFSLAMFGLANASFGSAKLRTS